MVKKILSVLLVVIMVLSVVPVAVMASDHNYQKGDIIEFGSYPQSQITDESLINELNGLELEYVEADYTDTYKYADVEYNNEKYRAVYTAESGTVSWFVYEPIEWVVIDPETGYVLCNSVLDVQPFKYNNISVTDNWANSDIRVMLNNHFYNIAFSSSEKESIVTTETIVETVVDDELSYVTVSDEVVLLSFDDVCNEQYGFLEFDGHREGSRDYYVVSAALCREASDYALSIGASACLSEAISKVYEDYSYEADEYVINKAENFVRGVMWLLNSNRGYDNRPTVIHELVYDITYICYRCGQNHTINGDLCAMDTVGDYCATAAGEIYGVCPAMHINLETFDKEQIPGDMDGNGQVTPSDARTALRIAAKLETATDEMLAVADIDGNGEVTPSDARTILRIAANLE